MRASIAVVVVVAAVGAVVPAAEGAGRASVVSPSQELAMLLTSHRVASAPGAPSAVTTLRALRPITAVQTVLPVVGHATTSDGARWLRVRLPGRPNGRTGWIRRRGTVLTTTDWHVVIRTSLRRVLVYRQGHLVKFFAAVVGKPSTPTPHGRFFVEESVLMPPGSPGAPIALALSAVSDVLTEFDGGPGQVAIHGVMNLGGTPGTAISHGCVRLADRSIRWLGARIAPGVPVTITA